MMKLPPLFRLKFNEAENNKLKSFRYWYNSNQMTYEAYIKSYEWIMEVNRLRRKSNG